VLGVVPAIEAYQKGSHCRIAIIGSSQLDRAERFKQNSPSCRMRTDGFTASINALLDHLAHFSAINIRTFCRVLMALAQKNLISSRYRRYPVQPKGKESVRIGSDGKTHLGYSSE
jgi:hypothetical protein